MVKGCKATLVDTGTVIHWARLGLKILEGSPGYRFSLSTACCGCSLLCPAMLTTPTWQICLSKGTRAENSPGRDVGRSLIKKLTRKSPEYLFSSLSDAWGDKGRGQLVLWMRFCRAPIRVPHPLATSPETGGLLLVP